MSTLKEHFDFARCADPGHGIQWNIESKINASQPSRTHSVDVFVTEQHAEFLASSYPLSQIMVRGCFPIYPWTMTLTTLKYQSLDWRSLIAMKVRLSTRMVRLCVCR